MLEKQTDTNESEEIDKQYISSARDVIILSGTVFGSTLALSVDRAVNILFILGEVFLFVSCLLGILFLYSRLLSKESMYFLMLKYKYQNELIVNNLLEKFQTSFMQDEITKLDKLYKRSQKGILYTILQISTVEGLHFMILISGLLGLLLLLLSRIIS